MNNGCFPAGEKCPEASLSLLYRGYDMSGAVLCAKTKSAARAEQILARGGLFRLQVARPQAMPLATMKLAFGQRGCSQRPWWCQRRDWHSCVSEQ